MKAPVLFRIAAGCLPLLAAGCAVNEGAQTDMRIEGRGVYGRDNLASRDLVAASDAVVESLAQVPELREADGRTVIVVDQVFNETSDKTRDYQIFLSRIRASLNQSAMREDLVFVESRDKAAAILQREGYPQSQTARTLPEYALTATFRDLRTGPENYYLLTFQLFTLRNQELLWEDAYEVKLER